MLLSSFPICEKPWRGAVRGRDRSRRGAEAECSHASSLITRKRTRPQTPDLAWARDEREDGDRRRRRIPHPIIHSVSEEPRRRSIPRLERQGAFCASRAWDLHNADFALDGISLYSLGVMHDDDNDNDNDEKSFCLDTAATASSPRPAKRTKRAHDRQQQFSSSVGLLLPTTCLSDDDDDDDDDNTAITRFIAPSSNGALLYGSSATKKCPTKQPFAMDCDRAPTQSPPPPSSLCLTAASDVPDLVSDTEEDSYYDGSDSDNEMDGATTTTTTTTAASSWISLDGGKSQEISDGI